MECPICLETFITTETVIRLNCDHIFHKECISEWGKWQQNCPYCKRLISVKT